jgi:hypothetical protein
MSSWARLSLAVLMNSKKRRITILLVSAVIAVSPPLSLFPDWAIARLIAIPDPDSLEACIG